MTKYFHTHTHYNAANNEIFKILLRIHRQFLFNSMCWKNIFSKHGKKKSKNFPTRRWAQPPPPNKFLIRFKFLAPRTSSDS